MKGSKSIIGCQAHREKGRPTWIKHIGSAFENRRFQRFWQYSWRFPYAFGHTERRCPRERKLRIPKQSAFGVTRGELVSWLSSHASDDYYLGTPFRQYDWRSPKGDINQWGSDSDGKTAAMNSTGFVWHALCTANNWEDDISSELPCFTGWNTVVASKSLETYTYDTKEEMLASGVLEKGDVIWARNAAQASKDSIYHHMGFFWGESSDQDLMWSSLGISSGVWSGANAITPIGGSASSIMYTVLKLEGEIGGISLELTSADESITDGNSGYSLEGAVFGVFSTAEDAATHDASKALKTYSTDANGKLESGGYIIKAGDEA